MENETQSIGIKVTGIREVQFSINDSYVGNPADLKINLSAKFDVDAPNDSIRVEVGSRFYSEKQQEASLVDFRCVTDFGVSPLKEFEPKQAEENAVTNLPQGLLTTLLSIAFSHARAMLASKTAGTKYSDTLLPIINPTDIINHMFEQLDTPQNT